MVNFDLTDPVLGSRFRWTEFPYRGDSSNNAQRLFSDSVTPELGKTHHIELTYRDGKLTYIFDGVTIFKEETDKNQAVAFTGGQIGVMGYNSTFTVNNVFAYEIGEGDPTDGNPSENPPPAITDAHPDRSPDAHAPSTSPSAADAKPKGNHTALTVGIAIAAVAAVCAGSVLAVLAIKKKKK